MQLDRVVISRRWQHPEITIKVDGDGITVAMAIDDFVRALLAEIGNPLAVLTRAQLEQRAIAATDRVIAGMKAETVIG